MPFALHLLPALSLAPVQSTDLIVVCQAMIYVGLCPALLWGRELCGSLLLLLEMNSRS